MTEKSGKRDGPTNFVATITDQAPLRHATWFELFFDLAFVLVVAALAQRHAEVFTINGAAEFALQFLILWQLWVSHTFWASRFDRDRIDQHLLGFAKIFAIVAMGYGVSGVEAGAVCFSVGAASFKMLVGFAYLRERKNALLRPPMAFAVLYLVQAGAWAAAAFLPETARLIVWMALLISDLATPYLMERWSAALPAHPEHLPERFGLFTIILLGETVASALHSLAHAEAHAAAKVFDSSAGVVFGCLFWIGYFHHAQSARSREMEAWDERKVRRWVYAHLPFNLGVVGLSAGVVALAAHGHAGPAALVMQAVAVAVAMAGLTLIGLCSPGALIRRRTVGRHMVLVLLVLPVGALGLRVGPSGLTAGLIALVALQVVVALFPSADNAANR